MHLERGVSVFKQLGNTFDGLRAICFSMPIRAVLKVVEAQCSGCFAPLPTWDQLANEAHAEDYEGALVTLGKGLHR